MNTVVYTAGWIAIGLVSIAILWLICTLVMYWISAIKTKMQKHTYRIKYVTMPNVNNGGRDDEKSRFSFWKHNVEEFICQAHDVNEAFAMFYKNAGVSCVSRFLVLNSERLPVHS